MSQVTFAHLGPKGTYSELAALAYGRWSHQTLGGDIQLVPCSSIGQTLMAVSQRQVDLAIVPVENSTEGGIAVTLDTLWEQGNLQIQQELVLPIVHALFSPASHLEQITQVYSHPQALGQCQKWIAQHLPQAVPQAVNSTTEALHLLASQPTAAAIASPRAAKICGAPLLCLNVNDYPDNCTRFWVVGTSPSRRGTHTALAFSVPCNVPGALVNPLQVLAQRQINLSRIESRPTKRSLGEYLFFMDLEASQQEPLCQEALEDLRPYTEILKIFGSYSVLFLQEKDLSSL